MSCFEYFVESDGFKGGLVGVACFGIPERSEQLCATTNPRGAKSISDATENKKRNGIICQFHVTL
jgi:hypothetical protein